MESYQYYIEKTKWKFTSSLFSDDILGVLISVDKKELYVELNNCLCPNCDFSKHMPDTCITLQKHGYIKNVKEFYLTYVDSPLRKFCDFHYIELLPTYKNCENINKIISTSCLPVKYLDKLIKDNT